MNRKILLFGANGMLGSYLSNYFEKKGYEVIKSDMFDDEERGIHGKDITNEKELKDFVYEQNPDYIINCAAYTNVNKAESEPKIANAVNATAPKYMAEVAKDLKIPFLHVSTNEVFGDGVYVNTVESLTLSMNMQKAKEEVKNISKILMVQTTYSEPHGYLDLVQETSLNL